MRKNIILLLTLALLFSLSACGAPSTPAAEEPAEATTDDGYIHIATAEEFCRIADDLGAKYILDGNIDSRDLADGDTFDPIGSVDAPFTGELNGNGYRVSGLLSYTGQDEAWGLFGCSEGTIRDLTLGTFRSEDLTARFDELQDDWTYASDTSGLPVDGTRYYGLLCGLVRGCNAEIDSEGRDTYFGGLCGFCAGRADVRDSEAHIEMGSYFYNGYTLYQSNALGYAQGEASFRNLKTDAGERELQTVTGDAESVFYLAALAGCAEDNFYAEGCEVHVSYNAYIGDAALHDATDHEGLYNVR